MAGPKKLTPQKLRKALVFAASVGGFFATSWMFWSKTGLSIELLFVSLIYAFMMGLLVFFACDPMKLLSMGEKRTFFGTAANAAKSVAKQIKELKAKQGSEQKVAELTRQLDDSIAEMETISARLIRRQLFVWPFVVGGCLFLVSIFADSANDLRAKNTSTIAQASSAPQNSHTQAFDPETSRIPHGDTNNERARQAAPGHNTQNQAIINLADSLTNYKILAEGSWRPVMHVSIPEQSSTNAQIVVIAEGQNNVGYSVLLNYIWVNGRWTPDFYSTARFNTQNRSIQSVQPPEVGSPPDAWFRRR